MPEWLRTTFESDVETSLEALAVRQLAALALGCVVAGIYRLTRGERTAETRSLVATLVLLTVLIAMVCAVIGDNVARAFSLVGALSIVRFRTVVEDTRDTAFVIFAVAVGMAVGSGYLRTAMVCIPVAGLAAFVFRDRAKPAVEGIATGGNWMLTVRTATHLALSQVIDPAIDRGTQSKRLVSTSTVRQGAAMEFVYMVRLREPAEMTARELAAGLNAVDGVLEVSLRAS